LIPIPEEEREVDPPDLRAAALDYLRSIKPAVLRGSDQVKRHWNSLWTAIKGGEEPRAALDRIRGTRQAADGMSAEDARQGLADDFTATCAAYLGQDIGEVSEQREELRPQRPAFDSWPDQRRAVAEDLMARAERMGRQMRRAKY